MGSVLVTNATVVTMDAQRRVIPNGAVGVHNGTIAAVGDAGQVAAQGPGTRPSTPPAAR